ncbi:MAG: hypothetical protein ACQ5SW_06625 [Sphaerochaetaceae bacterium]
MRTREPFPLCKRKLRNKAVFYDSKQNLVRLVSIVRLSACFHDLEKEAVAT